MKSDIKDIHVELVPHIKVEEISVQYRNGIGFLMQFSPTGGALLFRSDLWIMKDMVISGIIEKLVYNMEPHKKNAFNPEDYWIADSDNVYRDLERMVKLAKSITQEDFDVLWEAGHSNVCRNPKAMCRDKLAPIMQVEDMTERLNQIRAYLNEPIVTLHQEDVDADAEYLQVLKKYQKILESL